MFCPFCESIEGELLEFHHIDEDPSNTVFENLLAVCSNCHTKIGAGLIPKEVVENTKLELSKNDSYLVRDKYRFDNFKIMENRVGIISKGMTLEDVYKVLPQSQVLKTISYGENDNIDLYDSYKIFDFNGEHLLTIEGRPNQGLNAQIELILIISSKFKTDNNIGLGSYFGFVRSKEITGNYFPDIDFIGFKVDYLNAICCIYKSQLTGCEWYDHIENKIIPDKIFNLARIDSIAIHWD
ncbi:hypothetical protein SAMN06298216_1704 [Spirosomataceae bacterium TFI 002]|nr:hypothetical protein SAMN06298216_1704 [Spirosomataceae bacterium TFI 002]